MSLCRKAQQGNEPRPSSFLLRRHMTLSKTLTSVQARSRTKTSQPCSASCKQEQLAAFKFTARAADNIMQRLQVASTWMLQAACFMKVFQTCAWLTGVSLKTILQRPGLCESRIHPLDTNVPRLDLLHSCLSRLQRSTHFHDSMRSREHLNL